MEEHITVFVNGQRVELYRGMRVKHALIALDQRLYQDASEGRVVVEDQHGFRLGLDGALHPGAYITTRRKSAS
jgi:hypothetical protein